MAWIILHGPEGTRRVPEGVPYRMKPGEQVVGSAEDEIEQELHAELSKQGMGLGDFVEKAIKLIPESIRPAHCSKCEKRKQVLNHVRENGVLNTLKQLKEIG